MDRQPDGQTALTWFVVVGRFIQTWKGEEKGKKYISKCHHKNTFKVLTISQGKKKNKTAAIWH